MADDDGKFWKNSMRLSTNWVFLQYFFKFQLDKVVLES